MEVTAAWVRGQRFADVMQLGQDIFEGSLVRALRRTEELMGQVRGCCACAGLVLYHIHFLQRLRAHVVSICWNERSILVSCVAMLHRCRWRCAALVTSTWLGGLMTRGSA